MKPRDERFDHLLELARAGDECAAHDLWVEFNYDASCDLPTHLPLSEEQQTTTTHQEN